MIRLLCRRCHSQAFNLNRKNFYRRENNREKLRREIAKSLLVSPSAALQGIHLGYFSPVKNAANLKNAIQMIA